jgi:small-conductance mechanosensitive channel
MLGSDPSALGILAAYTAAGLVLGLAINAVLRSRLRSRLRAAAARHPVTDAIAGGLGHLPVWWLTLAGAGLGLEAVELPARAELYIGRTLLVLAGITATIAAARIATRLVGNYAATAEGPVPSTTIFVNMARIAVVLLGALLVLTALGISITPVLTALGVGGLAVALALQDTLSNLFAGIQIIASKQIRPGDYLELETGQFGTVEDITWRYTTMRTLTNNVVAIPNAKLAQSIVTNYQLPIGELSVIVPMGVAYGSDLERVATVASEVAAEVVAEFEPELVDYEPIVRFTDAGDSAVHFNVILRATEYAHQFPLKSEFIKRLLPRFAAEGIEVPFPQRVVHLVRE